ncbi:MAG TPA: hypothetical protein VLD13_05125 [Gaiellaceae bacterium]|nr:hypothetical protein [Gaiellaceae bacterium]
MTTNKQISWILVLVTTIGALMLLAGPASASSKPAGMTKAEFRALMLRSHALNDKYGLGQGMTKAEYRALMLRSEALNKTYHLGAFAVTKPAIVATSDSFAWADLAIGSAATLGGVLLAAGLVAGTRQARGALRARSSP